MKCRAAFPAFHLLQVNAAKRSNEARLRPSSSGRSAASQGVPRLPLGSLSGAATMGSRPRNAAAGEHENEPAQQHGWGGVPAAAAPLLRSPVRGRSASRRGAEEQDEGGLNFLPLARDERRSGPLRRPVGSTAATAGSGLAGSQQSGRRQSHVSLSDLLDGGSLGTALGSAAGQQPSRHSGPRQSAFSATDAASAAAAPAVPVGTDEPQAQATSAAMPLAPQPGQQQPPAAAAVVPGEAAAPPMQDTPRQPAAAQGAARGAEGGAGARAGACDVHCPCRSVCPAASVPPWLLGSLPFSGLKWQ